MSRIPEDRIQQQQTPDDTHTTPKCTRLQTTTAATSLPSGAVARGGGHVLDTANTHSGTGERAEGGLGTGTGGLGAVT